MAGSADDRKLLEDLWRARLGSARLRFDFARNYTNEVRQDHQAGGLPSPDGSFAYRQAVSAETMALAEYRRLLHLFAGLVLRGEIPDESEWPLPPRRDSCGS